MPERKLFFFFDLATGDRGDMARLSVVF